MHTITKIGNEVAHTADEKMIEVYICKEDGLRRIHLDQLFKYKYDRFPEL